MEFANEPEDLAVSLHITTSKQVWLEHCDRRNGDQFNLGRCVKGVYLRVDAKPLVRTTTKPKQIDAYRTMKNFQEGTPKRFLPGRRPPGSASS